MLNTGPSDRALIEPKPDSIESGLPGMASLEFERSYAAALRIGIQKLKQAADQQPNAPATPPLEISGTPSSSDYKRMLDQRVAMGKELSRKFYHLRGVIADERKAIPNLPVATPEDLSHLCEQGSAIINQIVHCKGLYQAAKEVRSQIETLHAGYIASRIRELKCDSASAVRELSSDLHIQAMRLGCSYLGLGKWFYGKRIAELLEQSTEASGVAAMEYSSPFYEEDLELLRHVKSEIDDPERWPRDVLEPVTAGINNAAGLLWKRMDSFPGPESIGPLGAQVVDSLVHDCQEKLLSEVRDRLIERSRSYDSVTPPLYPDDSDWRSHPLMIKAAELLQRALSVSTANSSRDWKECSAIRSDICAQPHGLLDNTRRYFDYGVEAWPRAIFQQLVWWIASSETREAARQVRTDAQEAVNQLWEFGEQRGISLYRHDDLTRWRDNPFGRSSKLKLEKDEPVINLLSKDLWEIVAQSDMFKTYTAQSLGLSPQELTTLMARACIRTLFDPELENAHWRAGQFLLQAPYPEFIPVCLLNCYRSNSSGHYQFRSIDWNNAASPLAEYALTIREDVLESLESTGVPAVAEVIKLIKGNLETFDTSNIEDPDTKTWVANPIFTAIKVQLERLAGYTLRASNGQANSFVLDLIAREDLLLTPHTAASIAQVLETTTDQRMLEATAKCLNAAESSIDAFRPIFSAFCRRAQDIRHEPKIMALLLSAMTKVPSSEQDHEALASLLDMPVEQAMRMLNMARVLTDPRAHHGHYFLVEVYRDTLELAKGGEATELLESLAQAKVPITSERFREIRELQTEPQLLHEMAAAAKGYGPYLLEEADKVGADSQFRFVDPQARFMSLLKLGPEKLAELKESDVPPAFLFGAVAQMPAEELTATLCARFGTFKALRPLFVDRYELERLITVLFEKPVEEFAVLKEMMNRFPELPRAAAPRVIALMRSAHVFRGQGLLQKALDMFTAGEEPSFDQLTDIFREQVLRLLESKYPKRLLSTLSEEDLDRFIDVYPSLEASLNHFRAVERIPMMRVLAIVELLGREKDFLTHNPELTAELRESAEEFFPDASERDAALAFIDGRETDPSLAAIFPEERFSAEQTTAALSNWHSVEDSYNQVITDASMEDKLLSVRNLLDSLFQHNHLSEPFKVIHQLSPGVNPQAELGQEWRRLKAAIEAAGNGGAAETEALRERLSRVEEHQRRLKEWEGLRKIGQRYDKATSNFVSEISDLRLKLGEYSEKIESLGFSFNDSFRQRIFSGDVQLLRDTVNHELASLPPDANDKPLKEIAGILDRMEDVFAKSFNYLQSIRPALEESLRKIQRRSLLISQLIGNIQDLIDPEEVLEQMRSILPEFSDYGRRIVHECAESDEAVGRLIEALERYKDSVAEADLKNTLGVISEVAAVEPEIFTIRQEKIFSRLLQAMQGQCMDYRLSHNNIGNSVYLLALQDGFRMLVAGFDESQKPRVNAVAHLMPVSLRGEDFAPVIVLDCSYVSDGSAVSWSKFEGLLEFMLLKAKRMHVPLVLPQPTCGGFRDRLLPLLDERGIRYQDSSAKFRILSGPTGGAYVEIVGYHSYLEDTDVSQECIVIAET